MTIDVALFGSFLDPLTKETEQILCFTITNKFNMSVHILTYGATVQSIRVPNKKSKLVDVCLGFDDMKGYLSCTNPYMGATLGRVCNRVGWSRFVLNGKEHIVSTNFKRKHQLHGGFQGFDKMNWRVVDVRKDGVSLRIISPDGQEGYPGEVTVEAHFTLTDENSLNIQYEAQTTRTCPINISNNIYFNLAGHDAGKCALYDHFVTIKATQIVLKDTDTIPTGEIKNLRGSPLDCRTWTHVGDAQKCMTPGTSYNDTYILDRYNNKLSVVGRAWYPYNGILMDLSSDQSAMHFSIAQDFPDIKRGDKPTIFGKYGVHYEKHGAFCMGASGFPDAMNHPLFPSVVLRPGQKYCHNYSFKFSVNCDLPDML